MSSISEFRFICQNMNCSQWAVLSWWHRSRWIASTEKRMENVFPLRLNWMRQFFSSSTIWCTDKKLISVLKMKTAMHPNNEKTKRKTAHESNLFLFAFFFYFFRLFYIISNWFYARSICQTFCFFCSLSSLRWQASRTMKHSSRLAKIHVNSFFMLKSLPS